MIQVVLVIHLILAASIIGLVLIQRSEGGGLGIGGGGLGGLASPQSAASVLTRATGIAAALFFVTSMTLAVMSEGRGTGGSIVDHLDKVSISQEAPKEEAKDAKEPAAKEKAAEKAPSVPVAE
jgi:preprotein translocase subunit SecG